jgi:hypothetical protein
MGDGLMRPESTPEAYSTHHTELPKTPGCWQVAAASVRGSSHEKTGQPCQDAHQWQLLPGDVLVGAVADGAGSAALGDVGASIAVQTAIDTLCRQQNTPQWPTSDEAWQACLTHALQAAQAAIEAEAHSRTVHMRDLATTLILVVATSHMVAVLQVGDGAAVVGDDTGTITALITPQSGEYINETTFLTSPDALRTAQVEVWHGVPRQIAAFSDGLQMLALKMPAGLPHAPFFTPLFHFMATTVDAMDAQDQLIAFLCSARVRARTDDDITLLLAARSPV